MTQRRVRAGGAKGTMAAFLMLAAALTAVEPALAQEAPLGAERERLAAERERLAAEGARAQTLHARMAQEQARLGLERARLALPPTPPESFPMGPGAALGADDPEALALYREAREHLNRGEMVEAASLFREIHEEYPDVSFAGRAQYYEALARIRQGTEAQRREATNVLQAHLNQYDEAETVEDARRLVEALREGGRAVDRAMEAVSLDVSVVEPCPEEVVQVRQAAFQALSRRNSDDARRLARDVALSEDPCDARLRSYALHALGENAGPEDVEILVEVVRHGDGTRAREQAAAALGQAASGDEVFQVLTVLAQDRDLDTGLRQRIVHQAIVALHRADEAEAGERFVELYRAVQDDEDLVRPVVFSLSRVDHPEAIAIVMDVARSGDDPELQRHAIHALGNVDDPEVDALLRELLGRDP